MASAQRDPEVARLYLLGPLRLVDGEGVDRTPRGSVVQALLALLALAPDGRRVRVKLQDLLWSGSDQTRGSQNLRTALSRLRQDLAFLPPGTLRADKQIVQLDLARLWIDVLAYRGPAGRALLRRRHGAALPDLLEGLDIRSAGEDDFEDWLREERQYWHERLEALLEEGEAEAEDAPPAGARAPARAPAASPAHVSIGLLPSVAAVDRASVAAPIADIFLDSLAQGLRDMLQAEIWDYREPSGALPVPADGAGPTLLLRVSLAEIGAGLRITLLVQGPDPRRLLWSWSSDLPRSGGTETVAAFANHALDRICLTLADLPAAPSMAYSAYHALNLMFRLAPPSLEDARAMLERAHAASGDPVHLGLLAYLNSFKVGEHWGTFDEAVREETRALVRAVLESNCFNALALAMAGHASGYVLHDNAVALDLLERSTELDPSLAICWDHLALNYLYVGRTDEALRASETAVRLGRFSPFRFTYDTTRLMIATVRGDYRGAIAHGERALARRPRFGAALRYMAVSLGHLGRLDEARAHVETIRRMAPDFSADWVANQRLAVADAQARSRLLIGLQRAGA